jgi:hypothetical protein
VIAPVRNESGDGIDLRLVVDQPMVLTEPPARRRARSLPSSARHPSPHATTALTCSWKADGCASMIGRSKAP